MAVPSAESIQNGAKYQRPKPKVRYDIVVLLAILVLVSIYNSIIRPTMHVVQEQDVAVLPVKHLDLAHPVEMVDSELLANEQMFLDTMKSCVPGSKQLKKNQKCGEYVPENNGNQQRIALLVPPGEMSNMIWKWVSGVVKQHEETLMAKGDAHHHPIEFIRTSHVPPYGYGKTHGLTKVIRLVPKPLVMGVADALQQIIVNSESHHDLPGEPELHQKDITLIDLKAVLRQFMRFHCRLSKLAAHTAIMNIDLNDFMDNLDEMTQKLYEFLKFTGDAQTEKQIEEDKYGGGDGQYGAGGMGGGMEDVNMLSSDMSFVKSILTRIQADNKDIKVLHVLDEVMRDELWKTKNLTNWPCESFWTVGEAHARMDLSHFAVKIARNFSPNCTAPFANCWVPRDTCEANGDGECQKK